MDEELPRGLHQRGQRPISMLVEEGLCGQRRAVAGILELGDDGVDRVGPHHMHAVVGAHEAACACGHDHRIDLSVVALAVVGAEVAGVGGGLVEVGLRGAFFALELEDDDGAADQQEDIGPPELQRELVLQNGAVLRGVRMGLQRLANLALQLRDAVVPGAELRRIDVGEECVEPAAYDARLGFAEDGEVGAPAVTCF